MEIMYAPQYYPQPQPMIPGYIQQVPIFQPPDHTPKRGGSPLMGLENDNVGKRTRQGSDDVSSIAGSPGRANLDLQDIMNELKKLATKEDLVQVKGTIVAQ